MGYWKGCKSAVEWVSSALFLGVHVSQDLPLNISTTSVTRKVQKRLDFLRKLRRAGTPTSIMYYFYRGTIESILTSCITLWYGACTISCRKTMHLSVSASEKIIDFALPSLIDTYHTCLTRKTAKIAGDPPTSPYRREEGDCSCSSNALWVVNIGSFCCVRSSCQWGFCPN